MNCIIRKNWNAKRGAGIACVGSRTIIDNCVLTYNGALEEGGAIYIHTLSNETTVAHCVIAHNHALKGVGGGLLGRMCSVAVRSCTFFFNEAAGGGALCLYGCYEAEVTNSILRSSRAHLGPEIYMGTGQYGPIKRYTNLSVYYSNVWGGEDWVQSDPCSVLNWDESNIDVDPCFVDSNNDDYHLKSQAGRWEPASQAWIIDDVTSPCIDAGDPMSSIGHEPFPNGGIINMGAYGGTAEASKSYFGEPICETIVAGDINGDCKVDFADFSVLSFHWLQQNQ